jgi:DnaJ-class molecular chaperone
MDRFRRKLLCILPASIAAAAMPAIAEDKTIECDNCGGAGSYEWEEGKDEVCSKCGGTGMIPNEEKP